MRGASYGIVERVAAGGSNDQHAILAGQLKGFAVKPRVFPASVVNEVVSMDEAENAATDPIA